MSRRFTPSSLAALGETPKLGASRSATSGISHWLEDKEPLWYLGEIGIPWGADDAIDRKRNVPTYRRGNVTVDMREGMSFVTIPFTNAQGSPEIAIVLRTDEEDLFGASVPAERADDAEKVAAHLNDILEGVWELQRERAAQPDPSADRLNQKMLAYLGATEKLGDWLKDQGPDWYLGSIGISKSPEGSLGGGIPGSLPSYRRGSLTYRLTEDMTFMTIPFTNEHGFPAIAIVLRNAAEDVFGASVPAERIDDAEEVAAFLNDLLTKTWALYRERAARPKVDAKRKR